ncbi:MAG: prolyl-tRNA synthetase associated domain-containing protein [Proteobacteria bacterium]|nr:prolyl-tRNA synthetase associated domain-containing protein [Pseudomonadota bacterium]
MHKKTPLLDLLKEHDFSYQLYEHEPVFTVEEGKHVSEQINGAHSKNLFLKDKKKNFFLVSVLDHKRVDLKALAKQYGKGGLSFSNAQELEEKLQLTPGSVTPYALLHDKSNEVTFILDEDFLQYELVNFHPLQNDLTIGMDITSFMRFFEIIHHVPQIIKIPEMG